jgi:tetratricopeptide (TPR) repeat protein
MSTACEVAKTIVLVGLFASIATGTPVSAQYAKPRKERLPPGMIRGPSQEILTMVNEARGMRNRGERNAALAVLEDALQEARTAGDKSGEAWTMNNIASVYRYEASEKKAPEYAQRAAVLYEQARVFALAGGDKHNAAYSTLYLGAIALQKGEAQEAAKLLEVALPLFAEVDDPYYTGRTLVYLGRAALSRNDPVKALGHFEQALPKYREVELWDQAAAVLREMASVYEQLGRAAENPAKANGNH